MQTLGLLQRLATRLEDAVVTAAGGTGIFIVFFLNLRLFIVFMELPLEIILLFLNYICECLVLCRVLDVS